MRPNATLMLVGAFAVSFACADEGRRRHDLPQVDSDAWLNGFVPVTLAPGDIARAVAVIDAIA